jgi:hypothetical protein
MVGPFCSFCSCTTSLRRAEITDAEAGSTVASAGTTSFQKLVGEKNRNGASDASVVELDAVVVVVVVAVLVAAAVVVVATGAVVVVVVVVVATGAVVVVVVVVVATGAVVVVVVATGAVVVVVVVEEVAVSELPVVAAVLLVAVTTAVVEVLVLDVALVVVDAVSVTLELDCSATGAGCNSETAPTGAPRLWLPDDPTLGGATANGPHALITAAC